MGAVMILLGLLAVLVMPILGWKGKGVFKRAADKHRLVGLLAGAAAGVVVFFGCMIVGAAAGDKEPVSASRSAATRRANEGPKEYPSGTWTVAIRSFDCKESNGTWDVGCEWDDADIFGHVSVGDERVELERVDNQSLRIVEVETGRLTSPVLEIEANEHDVFGKPRVVASKTIPIEENEGKWTRVDGAAVLVRFGENRKSPEAIGKEAMAAIADWSMKEVEAACPSRGTEACRNTLDALSKRFRSSERPKQLVPRYKAVFANVLDATIAKNCADPVDVDACSNDLKLAEWIADKHEESLPEGFASSVDTSRGNLKGATGAAFKQEATQKAHRIGKRVSFPGNTTRVVKMTTLRKWKNPKRQNGTCPYAYVVPEDGHYFVRVDIQQTNKSNELQMTSPLDGLDEMELKLIDSSGESMLTADELAQCFHRGKEELFYEVGTGRSSKSTMFFEVPASVDKRSLLLQAVFDDGDYDEPVKITKFFRLSKGS